MRRARGALGVVLVFVLSLLASGIVSAGQTQVIGKWDAGASYDAIAYGNYLYVASGSQVRIYDISTKEKIENIKMECIHSYDSYRKWGTYKEKTPPVNILHTDAGTIRGMYADGNYLYVIGSKFVIADISDPENAYVVSSLDIGGKDVQVQGNYAYLTTPSPYGDDITIIDISDKKNPVKVAGIDVDELGGDHRGLWRLYVEGNYLYTGDYNNLLYVFDISDPLSPQLVGKYEGSAWHGMSSFAKKGNYVYAVKFHEGFYVFDVSDPSNPTKVTYIPIEVGEGPNDIKILGDYLFVSVRYEGFRIYDISDPINPSLVTICGFKVGYAESIFPYELPHGTYVFETAFTVGWAIIDATDIENPVLMTDPMMPVPAGDSVKVRGNYAFIGAHNSAVWVLNVSDPANPKPIVVILNGGRNTGLEISEDGNYLYVAGSWSGLCIANISDPENPKWEIIDYGPNIDGTLIAVDNYLYHGGLKIYDVSDPKNPELVYSEGLYGSYGRVIGRYGNDYLIGVGTEGVFIVDISNRTNPVVVGNVSIPQEPNVHILAGRPAAISGSVVYVGADNRLYSVDISDPTNPVILDSVSATQPTAVVTYGSYAYAGARVSSWGLYAVNVSDPSDIKVEDWMKIGMNDLDEENGLLYTSGGTIISPIGGGELPLQIFFIGVSNITENSAIISWQTNKEADSLVKYGTSSGNYTLRKYNSSYVKYHRIVLSGLLPNTTYYFVVNSTDEAGNSNQSSEGSFFTPPTPPRPPSETVTIEGKEKVDDAMLLEAATDYGYYPYIYIGKYGWRTCRGVLKFNLSSIPRNASILSAKLELNAYDVDYNVSLNVHKLLSSWEEYEVTWYNRNKTEKWGNPGGDFGPAIETKSFNSSGKVVFECRKIAEVIQEWVKNPESNYGFLLEADAPEDKFFYIYQTEWNEKLAPKLVVTYELTGDVSPPEIRNVSVACTNNSATIEWDTDEISDSLVRYGTESGNYSYEAYDSAFVMHHNITIRGLESGRTYYFEVVSADMSGNKARSGEYKFKTRSSMPVTVVIGGENIEDAWLAKHLHFRNYGWYPWIYIGNTSYGIGRGIIKFNLSSIPANSKIIQAKLIVKINGPSPYGAPSNSSLSVHKVLNSWDEYEVTWDKRNKAENWNTSGGDFGPKIAEISNFSGHPTLVMNENITDVVKEWYEYPEKNYGFILEWDNAPEGKYFVIAQKEYYTEDAPKLEVTYIPPS